MPDYIIKSGTRYKLIHDQLGSVLKVVNTGTGAVASSFTYDEFGRILASTTPDFQPFGWAGGLRDDVTGFVRFGARDYDPETGRWTSKDLILFGGEDTNLYGYVLADPINKIDPDGKIWQYVLPAVSWCLLNPICRSGLSNLVRFPFQRHPWDPDDDNPPRPINYNLK